MKMYCLAFWMHQYVKPSLLSIIGGTKTKLDIVVGENASPNSDKIQPVLREFVRNGDISEAYFFHENTYVSAFKYLYELSPPDPGEEYVIFCELDLLWTDKRDWFEEQSKVMNTHRDVGCLGYDLDLSNYVPPNEGHLVSTNFPVNADYGIYLGMASGMWLLAVRTEITERLCYTWPTFIDGALNNWTARYGFKVGRMPIYMTHLGWDVWKDDWSYWAFKLNQLASFKECYSLDTYTKVTKEGEEDARRA